jgi:biopolymer transport protein TolR
MRRPLIEPAPLVAKINVTPIIDVALVLVIILLITAPMISTLSMDIDLPQARTRSIEDEVRISISLGRNGELAIDDEAVAPDALLPALVSRLGASSSKNILVVVRADSGIPYRRVKDVIRDAKTAGAQRIAIATRQRGTVFR